MKDQLLKSLDGLEIQPEASDKDPSCLLVLC